VTKWIRNGDIVDPVKGALEKADLIVEDGKIKAITPQSAREEPGPDAEVIDASGKLILPGLIDMHVHLREPGHEYKETVATGAGAAAAGGFTAVACMPNTDPPNDCRSVTEFILDQAKKAGRARVFPVAAITRGQKGESLTDFGDLKTAGAVALSDDGLPVVNSQVMRRALEYAHYHGLMVISHSEDLLLTGDGVMHEGEISTRIGLSGIPAASEDIVVYRDISLARLTRCPVHIAHVSTANSVELIRRAKEEGLPVTAETAPHYFTLDHRAVVGYDTRTKVKPPLRTPADVEAIRRGLKTGVLDVIATDHAPHSTLEKDVEFDRAAFGMIGLQTALPLTLRLVDEGVLSLASAIGKLSTNSARILNIPGGRLVKGGPADLAIVDPNAEYVFEERLVLSKSKNSPFIGKSMKGRNQLTMVGGEIVWEQS
jgi:dihydroorotase